MGFDHKFRPGSGLFWSFFEFWPIAQNMVADFLVENRKPQWHENMDSKTFFWAGSTCRTRLGLTSPDWSFSSVISSPAGWWLVRGWTHTSNQGIPMILLLLLLLLYYYYYPGWWWRADPGWWFTHDWLGIFFLHNPTGNPHQPTRIFHGMRKNALISHRDCEPFEGWLNISSQDSKSSKVNAPFFDGRKKRHRRVTSFPHISTLNRQYSSIFHFFSRLSRLSPPCDVKFCRFTVEIAGFWGPQWKRFLNPNKTAMVQDQPWSGDAQGGDLGMSPWGNSAWGSNGK